MANKKSTQDQQPGCFGQILAAFGFRPKKNDRITFRPIPESSYDASEDYSEKAEFNFPYRIRDDFLSPAEQSFYQVLTGMMGPYLKICPKVSLADIFFVLRPNENKQAYNRINRKHVDFLLCDPATMKPKFAIELDDSSHQRADRVERDEFVDQAFEAAGLPLVHIPVQFTYNTAELGVVFKKALQTRQSVETAQTAEPQPIVSGSDQSEQKEPPICPKCGVPMVLRTAKNGNQPGRKFYGCTNYPKCRVMMPIE